MPAPGAALPFRAVGSGMAEEPIVFSLKYTSGSGERGPPCCVLEGAQVSLHPPPVRRAPRRFSGPCDAPYLTVLGGKRWVSMFIFERAGERTLARFC